MLNNYRAQNGAGPLTISANLNRSASWMAIDLATKSYFSHTDSLGRSSSTRMANCGVSAGGTGENIGAGTYRDTGLEQFEAWKASSGHNTNMLKPTYRQIGIARYYVADSRYKWYWVADFSTVNDGTNLGGSAATATPTNPPTQTPSPSPTPAATQSPQKAGITSPTPGSVLPGSLVTFKWSAGTGANEYFFYLGTSKGSNNLFGKSMGTNLSATLQGLPTDGRTLYVRLWTRLGTTWQYSDNTYKAATQ